MRAAQRRIPRFSRQPAMLLAIAVFASIAAAGSSAPDTAIVDNHNVSVAAVETHGGVDLVANLTNCTDSTITVTGKLKNMDSSPPLPTTVDSAGRTKFVVARLTARNGAKETSYTYHFDSQSGGRQLKPPVPYVYMLPFRGVEKVAQGARGSFSHFRGSADEEAIDFGLSTGTTVYAARPGVVTDFRSDCTVGRPDKNLISAYNYVTIRHDDGTYAEYLHLSRDGVLVRLGERVMLGQPIAISGNTGYTSGPHLHFEVLYTIDGTTHRSLPVQFRGQDGIPFTAVEGSSYSNP